MQPLEQNRPWRWGVSDMAGAQRALRELDRELCAELAPAGLAGVRGVYETLTQTYASKTPGDHAMRLHLWVQTFQDWPRCALNAAMKAWALKDTSFMPTPGQFNACGVAVIEQRRADLQDVRHMLRVMDKPEDKDWDSFVPDPEVTRKLKRLMTGLRNGEDLRALRARGEI